PGGPLSGVAVMTEPVRLRPRLIFLVSDSGHGRMAGARLRRGAFGSAPPARRGAGGVLDGALAAALLAAAPALLQAFHEAQAGMVTAASPAPAMAPPAAG